MPVYFKKLLKMLFIKLPLAKRISYSLTRNVPRIFFCHRFDYSGNSGISNINFEWQLEVIKSNFEPMKLCDYINKRNTDTFSRAPVIITVDDGYGDFYNIAYPLLNKEQMPATLFIAAGFIDGEIWFWWDKLRYILMQTDIDKLDFNYNGNAFSINRSSSGDIDKAWSLLSDYCLKLPEDEKHRFVSCLADSMNVGIPSSPVEQYEPMTWNNVIEVSKNGVEIGSHTLSHPILANLDDKTLFEEVLGSKNAIEKKMGAMVKTFSYPNGKPSDYNQRVINTVKNAGYEGAVVAHDGICKVNNYAITRMCLSNEKVDFLWKLYGMNHIMMRVKFPFSKFMKAADNP
jgi:peptidoglycan/xylan/chitin deacetylase (PgdA/CDA1 family)